MSYSGFHETSNIRTFAFGRGAPEPRSGAALQRCLRDAPMPDTSGKLSRTLSCEDSPVSGMWLADGQERHTRLQRAWAGRTTGGGLLAPQARPWRFRCVERRDLQGDAPPISERVRIRLQPLDFGDGLRGRLQGGAHRKAGLGGDRPGYFGTPTRSRMAQSQKVDHLPRSPIPKKKRRRDRLMSVAATDPDASWAVGFCEECSGGVGWPYPP